MTSYRECWGCEERMRTGEDASCLQCWRRIPQDLRIDLMIRDAGSAPWALARAAIRGWLAWHPVQESVNEPAMEPV